MRSFCTCLVLLCAGIPLPAQQESQRPMLVLDPEGHTDGTPGAVFSPDGRELISVSRDRSIRIWDVASGEMLRVLRPPVADPQSGILYAAALTRDAQTLAVSSIAPPGGRNEVLLISLASGRILKTFQGHQDQIVQIALTPEGDRLATCSFDRSARIWDVQTGKALHVFDADDRQLYSLALSPDGTQLATGASDGTIRIWSVRSGASLQAIKDAPTEGLNAIRSLAWSRDGKMLASGADHGTLRIWNADGTPKMSYTPPQPGSLLSLDFAPDGNSILYGRVGKTVVLDLVGRKVVAEFLGHQHGTFRTLFSPDGKLAVTAGYHGDELSLWNPATGEVVHRLGAKSRTAWSAAWSEDGQSVAWGNTGRDTRNNEQYPLELAFNLQRLDWDDVQAKTWRRVTTKIGDRTLERKGITYDILYREGGDLVSELKMTFPRIWTFLPGGRQAVLAGFRGQVGLFDCKTGQQVRRWHGHTGDVRGVAPSPDGSYLLTAGQDQTLRIWTLDRDAPILSLFFSGREWIAWTPEGYYAASGGGERLMGWQVNQGPERMARYYPAAQFHASLFRPDVIRRLLPTGSLEKALELADRDRASARPRLEVSEVLPPVVVLLTPEKGKVDLREGKLEVRALARSIGKHPITAMRLLIDGRPYAGTGGIKNYAPPRQGEVRETWRIELPPGVYSLAAIAESAVSKGLSEPIEILLGTRGLAPRGTGAKVEISELPSLYVLAVGVSNYPADALKLQFAAKDAETLAGTFRAAGGLYRQVEVKVLVDREATLRNIRQGLTWLKKQMTQRDVGIVFFAGHGDQDNTGVFYLLPSDVDADDVPSTGLPSGLLREALQSIQGRVILMLDACHSGSVEGRRGATNPADELRRDLVTDECGVLVMCSSTGKEYSLESAELGHGFFTKALVEGLAGQADYNRDGVVYFNELDLYVSDRVKALSRGRQHPVTNRPASVRPFPLMRQSP